MSPFLLDYSQIIKKANTKMKLYKKGNTMINLSSFSSIMSYYNTFLVDISGIVHNGLHPLSDAIDCINNLIKEKKNVIFVSNTPWPSYGIKQQLHTYGIQGNYHVVTSGDLLHHLIKTTLSQSLIFHLGRNREHAILENTNILLTPDISKADAIILSCFIEDKEDHASFDKDLVTIMESKKPVYCPNPDRLALEKDFLRYPSGYFAHKLEQIGGTVHYLGKPERILYDFIANSYPDIPIFDKKTVMIGDTLETDIYGAYTIGIDSLLVLTGITALELKKNPLLLTDSFIKPTYILTSFC